MKVNNVIVSNLKNSIINYDGSDSHWGIGNFKEVEELLKICKQSNEEELLTDVVNSIIYNFEDGVYEYVIIGDKDWKVIEDNFIDYLQLVNVNLDITADMFFWLEFEQDYPDIWTVILKKNIDDFYTETRSLRLSYYDLVEIYRSDKWIDFNLYIEQLPNMPKLLYLYEKLI